MEISNQFGRPLTDPAGIRAEPLPGAGAPPKRSASSLTVTTAPAGVGPADGTDGISPEALDAALRRDDALGKFVDAVLGAAGDLTDRHEA